MIANQVTFFVCMATIIAGAAIWYNLKEKIWELQEKNKRTESRIVYLEKKTGYSLQVFELKEYATKLTRTTIKKIFMEKAKKLFPGDEYSDLWNSLADFTGNGDKLKENYSISIYDKEFDDLFDDLEDLEKKFRERFPNKAVDGLFDNIK